jgi:hypothetical protein
MKNFKIVGKVATFFGIASVVFVVLSAIDTFYLLQIASPSAPTEYLVFLILSNILPYLFVAVLSFVIAAVSRSVRKENLEKEAQPSAQPAEAVA